MREEWENYLLSKVELRDLQSRYKKKPKESKGFGILDGVVPISSAQNTEGSNINKQEHDTLVAAATEIRNRVKKDNIDGSDALACLGDQQGGSGKGKMRKKKSAGIGKCSKDMDNKSQNKAIRNEFNTETEGKTGGINPLVEADSFEIKGQDVPADRGALQKHTHTVDAKGSKDAKPLPAVHFCALESGQPILDILKPSVIVVYHPDMTFVREIEVYKAANPTKKMKVYFLFYEDSTEVQKFEASIRRENGAFESLIRQKSMMMIPVDQVSSEMLYFLIIHCI